MAWEPGVGVNAFTGGTSVSSASASIIVGVGAEVLEDGLTLIRMRGTLQVFLQAAASQALGFDGAVGIGIVTKPAFTIGVTAVPTPVTEQDWDGWLWWKSFAVRGPIDLGGSGLPSHHWDIDSKAMRKMRLGDTIYMAVEHSKLAGTATIEYNADTRILLKLP